MTWGSFAIVKAIADNDCPHPFPASFRSRRCRFTHNGLNLESEFFEITIHRVALMDHTCVVHTALSSRQQMLLQIEIRSWVGVDEESNIGCFLWLQVGIA